MSGTVRVDVFSSDEWIDEPLVEFARGVQGWLEQVPPEHREAARINVTCSSDYDGRCDFEFEVYYDRPETSEEEARRVQEEQERQRRYAREQELRERVLYEELRRKYGDR